MATNLTGFYLVFSGFFLMYFHFVLPAQVLRSPADLARRAEAVETGKKKRKNCHFLFRFHRSVSFWFFVLVFFCCFAVFDEKKEACGNVASKCYQLRQSIPNVVCFISFFFLIRRRLRRRAGNDRDESLDFNLSLSFRNFFFNSSPAIRRTDPLMKKTCFFLKINMML